VEKISKKSAKFILVWAFTIGIMIYLFYGIDYREVWGALRSLDKGLFLLTIAISVFGNLYLSCQKYRRLLQLLRCDVSLKEAILIKMGTIPIKNLLPAKSGEVLRAVYLKRRYDFSYLKGGSSIFFGMGLSVIALILFILLTGFFYNEDIRARYYYGLPMLGGLVLGAILLRKGVLPETTHSWLAKTNGRIAAAIRDITAVSHERRYKRRMVALFGYTIGFEGSKVILYLLLFVASGITIPPKAALFFIPMIIMVASLPITIFGLGTRDSALIAFFGNYAQPAQLLSAGIAISFVDGIVPLILGLALMKPFLARLVEAGEGQPQENEKLTMEH